MQFIQKTIKGFEVEFISCILSCSILELSIKYQEDYQEIVFGSVNCYATSLTRQNSWKSNKEKST